MNIEKIKSLLLKYYQYIIIFILIITNIIVLLMKKERIITNEIISECPITSKLKVDIKGSVNKPGVYEMDENSRVIDIINKSGGLLENADTSTINLSKTLADQMVIYIYSKEELSTLKKDPETIIQYVDNECFCPEVINDPCLDSNEIINNYITNYYKDDEKQTDNKTNSENSNYSSLISINKATKEELMTLPSIGESKAIKIIEYRNNSKFNSIEDIKNVSGIGSSIYEKIKDYITI